MAIFYKWEIIANKRVKQKIRKENTAALKENKKKEAMFYKKIWLIWPKPNLELLEWKIIADLWEKYKIMVRSRRKASDQEYKVMEVLKNVIRFDK